MNIDTCDNSSNQLEACLQKKTGITNAQKQKVARAIQEEEYTFEDAEKMVLAALA